MSTQTVSIRGKEVTIGTILVDQDPRVGSREVRVTAISPDGQYLTVRNTRTGRTSRLSVYRLKAFYGQDNNFIIKPSNQ